MSHTKSNSHGTENLCVAVHERTDNGRDDSVEKETAFVRNNSCSPDGNVRQRVLKEVGLTSTTFIGPEVPPNTVRSDIEDTLSEFYKELEKIDTPDGAEDNTGIHDTGFVQSSIPPKASTTNETTDGSKDKVTESIKTDDYQKSSGQKVPSWPHWYQNEPYHPRRLRPDMHLKIGRAVAKQNQWYYPQSVNRPRPPNPRFHRPPFHRPPPTYAFPNPQNPPPHVDHNWGGSGTTNHYQEKPHVPKFCRIPPPNAGSHHSGSLYVDSPQHYYGEKQGCINYAHHVNVGWSQNRRDEWSHLGYNYDRHQRYDSENELWEHHIPPPDKNNAYHSTLVLILMRGLPGSGKSTLARELLSTGPGGLILSTDDYFAHRDGYHFEADHLGAAHEWNQNRAKDAMHDGRSPIIIDNTNIQAWEMKPYVRMALEKGYRVDFCEPDTSWKFDPYELEKRNKHSVPREKIAQMMAHFSFPISIDIVMNSQEPLHVNQRRRLEKPQMMTEQDFY